MLSNKVVKKQTLGRRIARKIIKFNDSIMGLSAIFGFIIIILVMLF